MSVRGAPSAGLPRAGLGAHAREASPARLDQLSRWGILAIVLALFTLSGGVLWYAGYNYDGLMGSALTKLHPATYLTLCVLGWRACVFGNPFGYLAHVGRLRPASLLLVLISLGALVSVILRQRPNMAGLVDTFLAAGLLALLLADMDERLRRQMEMLLHGVMTVNGLMALFEFATKILIFPYRFDGETFPTDLRSAALQGHPLVNATLTACYVLALMSGARQMSTPVRLGLILLQLAAMVAFGGRTAIVTVLVLGLTYGLWHSFGMVRRRRIHLMAAALILLGLCLVPVALAVLISGGFFDDLLGRFVSDGGSANARVEMFGLFQHFSLPDLLIGPDVELLESLRRISGLEWGIENPIIRMMLYQGAFFMALMFVGFALFMRELARGRAGSWLPMIAWLILINGSESLASKTTLMSKFAVILLCLYRTGERDRSMVSPLQPRPVIRH
ncbi:VpsF family polysaccharide biosynthesis protein [Aureimonas ureilytica]|uniref:VpsF family polysaccharide biosynthesis protein n=1 Tax=Aureimonas ureilytica TaxID=401562 RepID=UPI0007349273|nr:VpsF family polysaccharide biosynthesis protein [Aureimonas ureilytica]